MGVYEVVFFAPRPLKGTFTTYVPFAYVVKVPFYYIRTLAYVVKVPFKGLGAKNTTS